MGSHGIKDQVAIIGVGCTPFAEHWDKSLDDLIIDGAQATYASAGVAQDDPDNQTGNLMPEFGPNLVSDEDLAILVAWLKTELQR